jgi:hypothetical protein
MPKDCHSQRSEESLPDRKCVDKVGSLASLGMTKRKPKLSRTTHSGDVDHDQPFIIVRRRSALTMTEFEWVFVRVRIWDLFLLAQPTHAPEVIRELVPMQAPIQPSGNPTKAPPDAPSATLTHDQQVDLAQRSSAINFSNRQKISRRSFRGRRSSLMPLRNARKVAVCGNARNASRNGERSSARQVT